MGLVADLSTNIRDAIRSVETKFFWTGDAVGRDLLKSASAFDEALETVVPFAEGGLEDALRDVKAFGDFVGDALRDPKQFIIAVFKRWDAALASAMAQLNVEIVGITVEGADRPEDRIAAQLRAGSAAAQERVTIAITVINFILVSGHAISIITEAASAGTVRSVAEAIQSWVWANGLGSFSPMAFQPQLNASVLPYLQYHYNSRAQAQLPPVTDVIRMQLREVFLDGRREELVGTEDRPVFDALMNQHGFNKFHSDSFWGAHWVLPSTGQLNEMLFRGVINRDEWERFIRFNDMEPSSIPRLGEIIYNPFTRVDIRRMARFGILNDDELLQAYADLGNFAQTRDIGGGKTRAIMVADPDFTVDKAQALVVFTKVFNAIPELRQRYAKGNIGADEVLEGILATGIPPLKAQLVLETIVKASAEDRVAPERELTRGLIARAWKMREISFPQATFLLQRIGWSQPEAELILRVQSQPDDPLAFVGTFLGARLGAGISAGADFEPETLVGG